MTRKMGGNALALTILLFSVVSAAAQTYTQMQWGINKSVTPYAFGANINGTWRDLGTVSAAGQWSIPSTYLPAAQGRFNVREYGTNVCTGSDDTAAFNAALSAGIAYGAVYSPLTNAQQTEVYVPVGFTCRISSTITINTPIKFNIQSPVYSTVSNGPTFLINSVAPAPGRNTHFDIYISSCVQTNGLTTLPTSINENGGSCVEIRNMQFSRLRIDDIRQFTRAGVYFNSTNTSYTGQHIQHNNIELGQVAFNGSGIKLRSISAVTGATNANRFTIQDIFANWVNIDMDDSATYQSSNSNQFFVNAMDNAAPGGVSLSNYANYNSFDFGYADGSIIMRSVANLNTITIANDTNSGVSFTDLNGSNRYKDAIGLENIPIGFRTPNSAVFTSLQAAGGTFTGATPLTVSTVGANVKIGSTAAAGTTTLTMFSSGANSSYDCKMEFSGGSATPGTGGANYVCGAHNFYGQTTLVDGAIVGVEGSTVGVVAFKNATSGTITLRPTTGALGTVTATLPANTGTIAETNLAQTWTAIQTFDALIKLKSYTVATLPACNAGAEGSVAYVTDATAPTYDGALTGGGAVKVPVFCNGAAWRSH